MKQMEKEYIKITEHEKIVNNEAIELQKKSKLKI